MFMDQVKLHFYSSYNYDDFKILSDTEVAVTLVSKISVHVVTIQTRPLHFDAGKQFLSP